MFLKPASVKMLGGFFTFWTRQCGSPRADFSDLDGHRSGKGKSALVGSLSRRTVWTKLLVRIEGLTTCPNNAIIVFGIGERDIFMKMVKASLR